MSGQNEKPFIFMDRPYINKDRLIGEMAASWKEGKSVLLSGRVSAYFKTIDRTVYNAAVNVEKAFHAEPGDSDLIFWRWVYSQANVPYLFWKNRNYGDIDQVICLLQDGTDSDFNRLMIMLISRKLFSVYVKSAGYPEIVIEKVKYVEKYFNKENSGYRKSKTRILLYVILSQRKKLVFHSQNFSDVKSFSAYLQDFADSSKEALQNKIRSLFLDEHNLEPGFEAWLLNMGFQHEVSLWNDKFQVGFEGIQEEDNDKTESKTEVSREDFSAAVYEFEVKFLDMLEKYPDILEDTRKFSGMLKDYFPKNPMQIHLIETLYKMDIVKALRESKEINDLFTLRFIKRLVTDFGTKEEYAKWAVSVWCVCYGEKILQKPCYVAIYKVY